MLVSFCIIGMVPPSAQLSTHQPPTSHMATHRPTRPLQSRALSTTHKCLVLSSPLLLKPVYSTKARLPWKTYLFLCKKPNPKSRKDQLRAMHRFEHKFINFKKTQQHKANTYKMAHVHECTTFIFLSTSLLT
jgi:hypothetical protein